MTERFARELTLDEQLNAQAFLELRARQVTRRALLLIILIPILTMIKVATIQFSFFLIPLYFFAFYLHSAIGVRIWRVKSGSRIVLWLRRFHRRDLRQFPFGTVLQSACMKIACPITIQDSTYELSWHALVARGAFVYLCAFLFATIVFISYQVSFVLLLELIRVRENAKLIITGVNLVLSVPIVLLVTYKLIRRACFMKLNRRNYDRKISKLIRNAKTGYATSALQIVKCDDDFWQNVVLKCMKSADAVIVDVSDINSNVDWELTQIRNFVKPEKLVLCCAARNGKLICDESTLIRNLKAILGQEDFTRSYRIVYELPRDLLGIIGFMERKFRDYGIITALRFSKDHLKLNQVLFLAVVSK